MTEQRSSAGAASGQEATLPLEGLTPTDPEFRAQLSQAASAAGEDDLPILIMGASGTGKELIARGIHAVSPRRDQPLIVIDCGALSRTLLESELFGHKRGSFTGAGSDRKGLLMEADSGTAFFDEIGELPLELQPALLRLLQFGEVRQLGTDRTRKIDFRLIAATNRDLGEAVRDGTFREDLYYRLNAVSIRVPPLAERRDDILPLFRYFFDKAAPKTCPAISPAATERLLTYQWPGNVRELENEARRIALLRRETGTIELSEFSEAVQDKRQRDVRPRTIAAAQRQVIERQLRASQGNRSLAARALGVSREGLRKMMERLDIGEATPAAGKNTPNLPTVQQTRK